MYVCRIHSGYWIGRSKQVGAMAHRRCCQTDIDGMLSNVELLCTIQGKGGHRSHGKSMWRWRVGLIGLVMDTMGEGGYE